MRFAGEQPMSVPRLILSILKHQMVWNPEQRTTPSLVAGIRLEHATDSTHVSYS